MSIGVATNLLNKDSLQLNLLNYWDEAFASLPVQMFKYKRWDWAAEQGVPNSVRPLLERMFDLMAVYDTEGLNWVVDYKVRELRDGACGCPLEGWHMDVVTNPHHNSRPDIHLIYSTDIGTEFLTQPIVFDESDIHFKHCLDRHNLSLLEDKVIKAEPNTVSMYNRFQLHRGPVVIKDCKRVLLRLTATEVIK